MKSCISFGALLGLVLLGALPAQTQALPPLCKASTQAVVALGDAAKPLWLQEEGGDSSIQATCSAWCQAGTQIEVTCSGSCTAVDINCPYTPGYVSCGSGSTTYCQPNPCPTGVSYCDAVNGTSCSPNGWTRSCTGSDLGTYTCHCRFGSWLCPI